MMNQPNIETRSGPVAVTGASGFVGRHLVETLVSRGVSVRALARDSARAYALLDPANSEIVVGDVFDATAMDRLCAGAAAVVHLVGIRRERPGGVTFERLHVEATRQAVGAAQRAGVRRFVLMSALGTRPDAPSAYHRTKHEAERLVRASGLDWTIFRPSLIHGVDGEFMELASGWVRGEAAPRCFLPYFTRDVPWRAEPQWEAIPDCVPSVQPVAVEDVCRAFADAIDNEETIGEVYALGGPDAMTWPELLTTIRDAAPGAKKRLRPMGVPADFARGVARVAGAVGLGQLLPFGPDDPVMASEDSVCSIEKARAHLGFAPRRFNEALASYAGRL